VSKDLETVCLKLEDKSGVFGNFIDIENSDQVNIEGIPTTELVRGKDAEEHAELVVRELIVWLNDSLNGIDGEIAELDASELDVPDEIMEQLRWKTQNMREEVETVGKNLLEQYFDSDKTLDSGRGDNDERA